MVMEMAVLAADANANSREQAVRLQKRRGIRIFRETLANKLFLKK